MGPLSHNTLHRGRRGIAIKHYTSPAAARHRTDSSAAIFAAPLLPLVLPRGAQEGGQTAHGALMRLWGFVFHPFPLRAPANRRSTPSRFFRHAWLPPSPASLMTMSGTGTQMEPFRNSPSLVRRKPCAVWLLPVKSNRTSGILLLWLFASTNDRNTRLVRLSSDVTAEREELGLAGLSFIEASENRGMPPTPM